MELCNIFLLMSSKNDRCNEILIIFDKAHISLTGSFDKSEKVYQ